MDNDIRDYAKSLFVEAQNYDEWLIVARFGLESLAKDPIFLIDEIFKEAVRCSKAEDVSDMNDWAVKILGDLGLRISLAETNVR